MSTFILKPVIKTGKTNALATVPSNDDLMNWLNQNKTDFTTNIIKYLGISLEDIAFPPEPLWREQNEISLRVFGLAFEARESLFKAEETPEEMTKNKQNKAAFKAQQIKKMGNKAYRAIEDGLILHVPEKKWALFIRVINLP